MSNNKTGPDNSNTNPQFVGGRFPSAIQTSIGAVDDREAVTCSVLCSLMNTSASTSQPKSSFSMNNCETSSHMSDNDYYSDCKRRPDEVCTDHLQLPMFLSKTYHMIDRCDNEIATWSENGDNFVVKNVEKFASNVLPLYFKHSNFSSFARQLNFYGFRKLRTDPILTSDVDPCTSSYVRFYHEKFQRGKPELLQQIKRATKTDQHSKDDIESLRNEVADVKDLLRGTIEEYDRKLAELSYECNRRISAMNAEYDNLAALVHRVMGLHQSSAASSAAATPLHTTTNSLSTNHSSSHLLPPSFHGGRTQISQALNSGGYSGASHPSCGLSSASSQPIQMSVNADLLHSLSQAAVSLQNTLRAQQQHFAAATSAVETGKRSAPSCPDDRPESPRSSRRIRDD